MHYDAYMLHCNVSTQRMIIDSNSMWKFIFIETWFVFPSLYEIYKCTSYICFPLSQKHKNNLPSTFLSWEVIISPHIFWLEK